jgi:hypothetical protein
MRRAPVVIGLAVAVAVGATAWPSQRAGAESPVKYGWWSATNTGGLTTPPPPQVPKDGLYIANGLSGPTAIAAVTYDVPAGSSLHPLVLQVSGPPLATKPPIACVIDPAGAGYQPAQDGAWAKKPSYDCKQGSVTGQKNAAGTAFAFDVAGLVRSGAVSVVLLGGANADQIVFNRPGPESLVVAPAPGPAAGSPSPPSAEQPVPGVSTPAPSTSTNQATVGGAAGASGLAAPAAPTAAAVPPSLAPALAGRTPAGGAVLAAPKSTPPRSFPIRRAGRSGIPGRWAKSLGLAGLLGFLGAYALGYGILGGRIGRVGLAMDDE